MGAFGRRNKNFRDGALSKLQNFADRWASIWVGYIPCILDLGLTLVQDYFHVRRALKVGLRFDDRPLQLYYSTSRGETTTVL